MKKKAKKNTLDNRGSDLKKLDTQEKCDEATARSFDEAAKYYEKSPTAEFFRRHGNYLIGEIIRRRDALARGELPHPICPFDQKLYVDAFDLPSYFCYVEYVFDAERKRADECIDFAITKYAETQNAIRQAVVEYATTAAVLAKHIDSASLDGWAHVLDIIAMHPMNPGELREGQNADYGQELVDWLLSSCDRLRLDMIIARLPAYKCPKCRGKKGGK